MIKKLVFITLLLIGISPFLVHAQIAPLDGGTGDDLIVEEGTNWKPATQSNSTGLGAETQGGQTGLGKEQSGSRNNQTQFLQNPLKGVTSIGDLVKQLVNLFTTILWIIAAIMLLWSGFMYIKAQGDPDAIAEAHTRFKNVLIGIAIIAGANTLSYVVQDLVRNLSN